MWKWASFDSLGLLLEIWPFGPNLDFKGQYQTNFDYDLVLVFKIHTDRLENTEMWTLLFS